MELPSKPVMIDPFCKMAFSAPPPLLNFFDINTGRHIVHLYPSSDTSYPLIPRYPLSSSETLLLVSFIHSGFWITSLHQKSDRKSIPSTAELLIFAELLPDYLTICIQKSSTTVTRVDCCICLDVFSVKSINCSSGCTDDTSCNRLSI